MRNTRDVYKRQALEATLSGSSQTLRSKLLSAGVFTQADAITADTLVTSARL